jgi:chaperonin GroES
MIKPLADRVVIKPDKEEEVTASGILVSRKGEKPMMTGEVIEVGSEVQSVMKGDHVIFAEQFFETYKQEEIKYQIGKEEEILAIITSD